MIHRKTNISVPNAGPSALVADIGATKSLVALVTLSAGQPRIGDRVELESLAFPSLQAVLTEALRRLGVAECSAAGAAITHAIVAIPGPVHRQAVPPRNRQEEPHWITRAQFTNLRWPDTDDRELQSILGCPVLLTNDMEALAEAIASDHAQRPLRPDPGARFGQTHADQAFQMLSEHSSIDTTQPILVVGLGTGFGTALRLPDRAGNPNREPGNDATAERRVLPGEGGHASLHGDTPLTRAIVSLQNQSGASCSREQLLAGPGIERIAATLRNPDLRELLPEHLANVIATSAAHTASGAPDPFAAFDPPPKHPDDPSAQIVRAAASGDPFCELVIDCHTRLLASALADLALGVLPTGGIVLGGGVTRHLAPWLDRSLLRRAFVKRAPMSAILAKIPLARFRSPQAALHGLANMSTMAATTGSAPASAPITAAEPAGTAT